MFRALRWQYLLRPIGHVRFGNALRTTIIGFAASALLPARAGEVLRPYLLARKEGLSATAAFATIIVERLLDTVTVLLLFAAVPAVLRRRAVDGVAATTTLRPGEARRRVVAAGACVVVLVVLFFLAGHPGTLERADGGLTRVLPAAARRRRRRGSSARLPKGLAIVRQPGRLLMALVLSVPLWLSIAPGIWLVTRAFHIDMPFSGRF